MHLPTDPTRAPNTWTLGRPRVYWNTPTTLDHRNGETGLLGGTNLPQGAGREDGHVRQERSPTRIGMNEERGMTEEVTTEEIDTGVSLLQRRKVHAGGKIATNASGMTSTGPRGDLHHREPANGLVTSLPILQSNPLPCHLVPLVNGQGETTDRLLLVGEDRYVPAALVRLRLISNSTAGHNLCRLHQHLHRRLLLQTLRPPAHRMTHLHHLQTLLLLLLALVQRGTRPISRKHLPRRIAT